ncbi:helix-turn-helix transcriptional regulator [Kribbella sandramycini]|uniref:AraC-like DNA-binding protein n=1 Tax=Kribbella sandramycini TaxID=60450 RepID=A0A7Y4L177_9ACTN|nr:AraC family transcriptional regulator [Kribbella sandramycini]MBB6564764.1 AraC-like DNA-binding protein [Kribbella sandramycini]NOL42465.1 helix-turn-helix transcriptional regulator [Kribbella sandramycini]
MIALPLAAPPEVVNVGSGTHGIRSLRDVFQLPDLWQLHLYAYSADLTIAGTTYAVAPGYVSLTPAGVQVQFDYRGRSEHLYAHFRPAAVGEPSYLPAVQDAGPAAPALSALLRSATEASPSGTARVAAEVWTFLWRLADLAATRPEAAPRHPAVTTAVAHIEAHLTHPLTIPALARAAGVSHNHLTRLFQSELGTTVIAYIRERRLTRARHLLTSSTLSIPAIAASVGIPDLQAFNKACHRELGASPRTVRETALTNS